jgi:Uma2 family endonuclease
VLRVRVPTGLYTYPDIAVIGRDIQFSDSHRDTVVNPKVIVEVLSKSTEAYDRGRKFAQYRQIESLDEYVLVSQAEPRVETFLRQPTGQWLFAEYSGEGASVVFKSIDCTIPLAEIYAKVPLSRRSSGRYVLGLIN